MRNTIFILFFFGIISLFVFSCEEEPELISYEVDYANDTCGCDSIILFTITETEPLGGSIGIKIPVIPKDTYYNYKYWIGHNYNVDCIDCIHRYIVCNYEFIPEELRKEMSKGESINVVFSGIVKSPCESQFDIPERATFRIILTKIEKSN